MRTKPSTINRSVRAQENLADASPLGCGAAFMHADRQHRKLLLAQPSSAPSAPIVACTVRPPVGETRSRAAASGARGYRASHRRRRGLRGQEERGGCKGARRNAPQQSGRASCPPCRSYSRRLPILSVPASSTAWRGRAAPPPDFWCSNTVSAGNGWNRKLLPLHAVTNFPA